MFLGLLDPDPDPLVRGMDPDPSLSKNSKKNLDFYCFDFLSLKNDVMYLQKVICKKLF